MIDTKELKQFLIESNAIEGIHREVRKNELSEAKRFLARAEITIIALELFVEINQPGACLRDKEGMNVRVGGYIAPPGGANITAQLIMLLDAINGKNEFMHPTPYRDHRIYENLHPFTDCNGRSGRILWLWQMQHKSRPMAPLGFLQTWYYQSLEANK